MSLLSRLRPNPPKPAPRLSVSEALTASAHGFTGPEWLALDDTARAQYRATITNGKHFTNGTQ